MKLVATGVSTHLGVTTEKFRLLNVGIKGPKGDPGSSYTHTQSTPASTWIINHTLGHVPSVELYDASGNIFFSDVVASSTTVTVTFPSPTSGMAILV